MKHKEFKNPFIQRVYDQVHKKQRNCLIVITGDTGKGKSYIAMKIAHSLDPEGFNEKTLRERLIADPKKFVDLVVNKRKELYTGACLVFDEAGTGLAAREWYSHNNKAIDYILQTFRYQKLVVIFTVPNMSFIDKHARQLFHYYLEALDVDIKRGLNIVKLFELSYNKMKPDEPYRKYLRNGRKKLKRFKFKKVPARLWHVYEKYAEEFKIKIGKKTLEPKEEMKKEVFDPQAVADKILLDKKRYFKVWAGKVILDIARVELDFKIGGTRAQKVKRLVLDKYNPVI